MNRLQQIEFNILKEFVSVCERYGLKYWLVCGSALGAVKYGGFIPWDDDIDVALPRKDYERLLAVADEAFGEGLFLQNFGSEPEFPFIYSKLIDTRTTYVEAARSAFNIKQCVFIDVFPLDGYPRKRKRLFELKKAFYVRLMSSAFAGKSRAKALLTFPLKAAAKAVGMKRLVRGYSRLVSSNPLEDSGLWCNFGNSRLKVEYAPRSQYGDGTRASFESLSVVVPENYDAYLTQKYGKWREDLPESEKKGHHGYILFDPDRPWGDESVKAQDTL
ncbi:MAG: LicD family protein [Clostridia bacterium]|nr:LicD family protein [Clostridia bacterium]